MKRKGGLHKRAERGNLLGTFKPATPPTAQGGEHALFGCPASRGCSLSNTHNLRALRPELASDPVLGPDRLSQRPPPAGPNSTGRLHPPSSYPRSGYRRSLHRPDVSLPHSKPPYTHHRTHYQMLWVSALLPNHHYVITWSIFTIGMTSLATSKL